MSRKDSNDVKKKKHDYFWVPLVCFAALFIGMMAYTGHEVLKNAPWLLAQTNGEWQVTNSKPQIDTTGSFLDAMKCPEIIQFVQDVVIDQHAQPDAITAHAADLKQKCLASIAIYPMEQDSAGNVKYLVNGTWKHLEMTH